MNFTPTDEQWEKMKKHIKSDQYKKEDFFVFETLATGDRIIPNRYVRLMPDLLNTMKEDADKGVSLMLNHNWSQAGVQSIPIGKVFEGRIDGPSQDGETTTLYTTQYILKDDSKVDGYSKNDIIKLIETGIISDTSVGISTPPETQVCSICGNSIYDWKHCEHVPGKKYVINKKTGEQKECIVEVHSPENKTISNNVLMENSVVFDGAYPNAIIQAKMDSDKNNSTLIPLEGKEKLSPNDIIIGYSNNGDMNLFYKHLQEKGGSETMANNEEEKVEKVEEVVEEKEEVVEETVEDTTENVEEVTEETTEEVENVEPTVEETTNEEVEATTEETMYTEKELLEKFENISDNLDTLVKLAKEGLENRNETIKEALNSGVRAMGNAFDKDVFEKTFSNMETADIKQMRNAWEKQVENNFSTEKVSKEMELAKDSENENNYIKANYKNFKTGNY